MYNPNPNPNTSTKQHAVVIIQQNTVTCATYSDKFIRDMLHCLCDFNNNDKHICKAPYSRNFRGAGGSRLCTLVKGPTKYECFSLDLNTDSESLPMTDAGSEFQTDGAAHRKERFAKSVRANGWMSSGV